VRIALSKGFTRLGAFLYLKMEAELASQAQYSIKIKMTECRVTAPKINRDSENNCVIGTPRSNPNENTGHPNLGSAWFSSVPQRGHDHFRPNPFQFTIHKSSHPLTPCSPK
jgi:hypothetical protein